MSLLANGDKVFFWFCLQDEVFTTAYFLQVFDRNRKAFSWEKEMTKICRNTMQNINYIMYVFQKSNDQSLEMFIKSSFVFWRSIS